MGMFVRDYGTFICSIKGLLNEVHSLNVSLSQSYLGIEMGY